MSFPYAANTFLLQGQSIAPITHPSFRNNIQWPRLPPMIPSNQPLLPKDLPLNALKTPQIDRHSVSPCLLTSISLPFLPLLFRDLFFLMDINGYAASGAEFVLVEVPAEAVAAE